MASTNMLDWDKGSQTFTAEASTLGAGDESQIVLSSDRVDETVIAALETTDRDDEGDVLAWTYRPVTPAWATKYTITVYND